jgi:hypothetical protein
MRRKFAQKPSRIVISGSCINFNKEREKILEFVGELEWGLHQKTECECSSTGKTMGWDFFQIYFDSEFVEALLQLHPEIEKEEGSIIEQQFAFWLEKQFKKRNLEYYLKLSEVPYESTYGFRLNPEYYRDDKELEELR